MADPVSVSHSISKALKTNKNNQLVTSRTGNTALAWDKSFLTQSLKKSGHLLSHGSFAKIANRIAVKVASQKDLGSLRGIKAQGDVKKQTIEGAFKKAGLAFKPVEPIGDIKTQTVGGVKIEGYDTLSASQKNNLRKELNTYKEKITKSIKNGNFDKFIEKAFSRKVDNPQELAALKKAALEGDWDKVIPKIKIGSQADFGTAKNAAGQKVNAMGAFIKGSGEGGATGTIIMNKELLNGPVKVNGKAMTFQNVLTEEVGHAWDSRLNKTDSKGDEGEALSIMFSSVDKTGIALQKSMNEVEAALKENDHGTMTVTDKNGNKKSIEVEFGFFKKLFKGIKKGFKKIGSAIKKVGKAIVKGVKKLAQSKIFAIVLQVAQFIPALAPFVAVARGAMAAYNIAKGIKDGNLMQVVSGVAGGALGSIGRAVGASASTLSSLGKVASYASKANSVMSAYKSLKNGDITGAIISGASAAKGAELIDKSTFENIRNVTNIVNVAQSGDITRGVQLGLQYANGTEWAKENQENIDKVNSAFNLYSSLSNGTTADSISAAANFGQQMGIINKQVADDISFATDTVSAVKQGDISSLSQSLLDKNFIDKQTAFRMHSAGDFITAVKNQDVNALTSTLAQNGIIDKSTADNVIQLSDYYKHGNNIHQMIRTGNFDPQAANDAYEFLMTGTDNKSVLTTNLATQNSRVINSTGQTPGFSPIPVSSFAGSSDIVSNKSATLNRSASSKASTPRMSSSMPAIEDLKPLPARVYPPEVTVNNFDAEYTLEPIVVTASRGESTNQGQSALTTGADIVTDFTPGVSNIKDATIAYTGVNPVTGEKVGVGGRILSGIFALPVVGNFSKYIAKGGALIYKGIKFATKGTEVTSGIAKATGRQADNVAGSIRNVNPTKGRQNCVNCSIATDSTLGGRPASALSGKPTSISELEVHFGGKFGKAVSKSDIEATLLEIGHGARGIVFGSRGNQVGHVFNVVNQNGVIRFLDGQTGSVAKLTGFTSLHLLKTSH